MVEQMSAKISFGFILFPVDTFPPRGIEAADEKFKARALRFVEKLEPNGGTPLGEAIVQAFAMVPEENVDTFYVLSDGAPSDVLPDRLLDLILEYNASLGVRMHTVWLGGDPEARQLLKDLAARNRGLFWEAP